MAVERSESDVLIVGAGPVGLTLAIDLGRRGIRCHVVERNTSPRRLPKMERCNARTMEIYRRLGAAERIRAAGLPQDVPMDVYIVTRLCDPPILRLPYPSPDDHRARIAHVTDGSEPLEPYQLVSQYSLEPVLRDLACELPSVSISFGTSLTSFEQDDDGVTALLDDGSGSPRVRSRYLVGCDGGRSTVRKQLGIELAGRGAIAELRQVFFRSEQLVERIPRAGLARHFYVADDDPRMIGTAIVVQDDQRHFVYHTSQPEGSDYEAAIREVVGAPIDVEILAVNPWKLHLLLADHYADGRVLLAGDAVHLVIPQGGLGMNTGVGDAVDLGWKLAGTLGGWGGPELLGSYESERRRVGERVIEASGYAAEGTAEWRQGITGDIRDGSEVGRAVRARVATMADRSQRRGHEMYGIELGYRYSASPIIDYGDEPTPAPYGYEYVPTAYPGSRLPHTWLEDGTALHDRLGDGFTLLTVGPDAPDATGLQAAFASLDAPLDVLHLHEAHLPDLYGTTFLLLRPDLHVAWRGDALPDDVAGLAARVTGWGGAEPKPV